MVTDSWFGWSLYTPDQGFCTVIIVLSTYIQSSSYKGSVITSKFACTQLQCMALGPCGGVGGLAKALEVTLLKAYTILYTGLICVYAGKNTDIMSYLLFSLGDQVCASSINSSSQLHHQKPFWVICLHSSHSITYIRRLKLGQPSSMSLTSHLERGLP